MPWVNMISYTAPPAKKTESRRQAQLGRYVSIQRHTTISITIIGFELLLQCVLDSIVKYIKGFHTHPIRLPRITPLQTKNPDIFLVYSTSRQYVGEYAGNIPAIVPNSLDSHYSQSNNRSTSNISRIYRSPYIREESYMFEYTDTVSGSGATRYREYTGFFICREYID